MTDAIELRLETAATTRAFQREVLCCAELMRGLSRRYWLGAGGTTTRLPTDRSMRKLNEAMQGLRSLLIGEPVRRREDPAAGFIVRRRSLIVIQPEGEDRAGTMVVPGDFTAHDLLEESADLAADFPGRFAIT